MYLHQTGNRRVQVSRPQFDGVLPLGRVQGVQNGVQGEHQHVQLVTPRQHRPHLPYEAVQVLAAQRQHDLDDHRPGGCAHALGPGLEEGGHLQENAATPN